MLPVVNFSLTHINFKMLNDENGEIWWNRIWKSTDRSINITHCLVLLHIYSQNFCSLLKWISFYNLSLPGEFTVFAPTNQAFERLPATTLSYLSSNTQALADVLKYHVVSGTVMKSAASNELQVTSLAGSKIRFNIYPFNGMVNWFLKNNCLQF